MDSGYVGEVKTVEWTGGLVAGDGERGSWMDWPKEMGRVCHTRCGVGVWDSTEKVARPETLSTLEGVSPTC